MSASPAAGRPEPPWRHLLAYALPALPLALLTLPFYVIVPSAYVNAGLPIALVGQIYCWRSGCSMPSPTRWRGS